MSAVKVREPAFYGQPCDRPGCDYNSEATVEYDQRHGKTWEHVVRRYCWTHGRAARLEYAQNPRAFPNFHAEHDYGDLAW